jgi:hypothetical protein
MFQGLQAEKIRVLAGASPYVLYSDIRVVGS